MPASPSVLNYQYGAGALWLKVDDIDEVLRHVGNMRSMTLSKNIESIEHKQTMSGLRSTDLEIITEVGATVEVELEEVTPENMSLFVMGTPTSNTDGGTTILGLSVTALDADFQYVSDNARGRNMIFSGRCSIKPNGDFSFITDGLTAIPLTLKVLQSGGAFGTWDFQPEA